MRPTRGAEAGQAGDDASPGHARRPRRGGYLGRPRDVAVVVLALLSLALGIAGNGIVYSLVDSLVNLRLPYTDPERIVLLGQRESGTPDVAIASLLSSLPVWADYRERSATLTDWAAITLEFMNVSEEGRTIGIMVGSATPTFFQVLGEQTVLGRVFTDAEGVPGGPRVAVLDWDYWQNALGARGDVVGSTVTLDGVRHEVIGVLPEGYDFLTPEVSVWVPMQESPYAFSRGVRRAISIARMRPGVTMPEVKREMQVIAEELAAAYPETFRGWTMSATNLGSEFPDPQGRLYMAVLRASVLFVLLIACANITNLLMARSEDRRREIAVRTALGAGRLDILLRLGRESMAMAVAGGAVGLALTALGVSFLGRHLEALPFVPGLFRPEMNTQVVLLTLAMTVLSGVLVGVLPVAQAFRVDQVEALKAGGGKSGRGRRAALVASGLVVGQIALSFVALGGGLALTRSFLLTMNRDPGFDQDGLLTVGVEIPTWKLSDEEGTAELIELRDRVERLPGVTAATLVTPLPKNLAVQNGPFFLAGEAPEGADAPQAQVVWAHASFVATFGVPLLRGRFFAPGDDADGRPVVVVSRSLADRYFPSGGAVGEQIVLGGVQREVVGVVADTQQGIVPRPGGGSWDVIYVPLEQNPRRTIYLVARTDGLERALVEPIRSATWSLDPDLAVNTTETFREYASRYTAILDVFNQILSGFGVLALLLASLGTWGVVAYSVSQRRPEIGVRVALGSKAGGVVRLIAGHGVKMTLAGLAVGVALLVPLLTVIGRILEGFALAPVAPGTVVGVGFALLAVGVLASVVPATRAATVDPVKVLKAE